MTDETVTRKYAKLVSMDKKVMQLVVRLVSEDEKGNVLAKPEGETPPGSNPQQKPKKKRGGIVGNISMKLLFLLPTLGKDVKRGVKEALKKLVERKAAASDLENMIEYLKVTITQSTCTHLNASKFNILIIIHSQTETKILAAATTYVSACAVVALYEENKGTAPKASVLWNQPGGEEEHPRGAITVISNSVERVTNAVGSKAMRELEWETVQQYCKAATKERIKKEVDALNAKWAQKSRQHDKKVLFSIPCNN